MSVYTDNGYKDRADYLKGLAEEYEIPLKRVLTAAAMLGENEDFDGLVTELEDMCDEM
jgi:hypothetical protein